MTRQEKAEVIEQLTEKFKANPYFYIADAGGMTVEDTNKFRAKVYKGGMEYVVAKNTLIYKALQNLDTQADYTEFNEKVLKGFSGIIFHPETGNAPAKMLKDFYGNEKDVEKHKPKLKGASIDEGIYIGQDQLDTLTKVKSKQELLGDVLGLLQSPMKNVISALTGSSSQKIAGLVKALEERGEQSNG